MCVLVWGYVCVREYVYIQYVCMCIYMYIYIKVSVWFIKHNPLKTFGEIQLHSFLIATPEGRDRSLYRQPPYPPGQRVRWHRGLGRRTHSQSGRCGSPARAPVGLYTGCDVLCTSQADSRRPSVAVARVRAQAIPCGICGEESGIDTVFLRLLWFSYVIIIPPILHPHSSVTDAV
jgi:hypothetical protein